MSLFIYRKLGLGAPKRTTMGLLMTVRTVKKPTSFLQDVLMKVESFNFLEDLMILDSGVYFDVPIILRRLLLANGCAFVNMERGKMKFQLNYEKVNHIVE